MKLNYLIILLLLLIPFCFSAQSSVTKKSMTDNIRELQDENANSEIQIEEKEQIFNLQKEAQLAISDNLMVLIKGFFILVANIISLVLLYVEMRIVLFVLLTLIPKGFNSMSIGIAKGFQGGRQ